jgi:glycolate oxidase
VPPVGGRRHGAWAAIVVFRLIFWVPRTVSHTVTEGLRWEAACAVFDLTLRLGGTLTGEHGVGILKRAWLRQELGEGSLALQRGIKAVFDPLGILNPGKGI